MNLDGSGKRQVTFFNDPNPPNASWDEYDSGGRRCSDKAWNPDGTKLVFFSFDGGTGEHYYEDDQYLYILEFSINETGNQQPNKPVKPSGETNGKVGSEYIYTTSTTDPDGDQICYLFDWGDEVSNWDGPYNSGYPVTKSHTWSNQGTYAVKVKAKDTSDAESVWSDPLPVSMPKNKLSNNMLFYNLLEELIGRFPFLERLQSILE